jgi:DHA2 family multidrug resistance protein-like MFS transporter
MLITARASLGIAGATLGPSTLALIGNMFRDPRQRTFAVAVWATSLSAGGAIGPMVGGVLLEWFWWGSAFLLAVPVMAVLLVTAPLLLPEYRDTSAGRVDLISVALSLATVLPVVYGLKRIAQDGPAWAAVLPIVAGLAVGTGFVRRQRTLANPLIDLRLFRLRAFAAALAANTVGFFVLLGVFFLVAQYLQLVLGFSPLRAGLWTVPSFGGFIVGSMLTPRIVRRIRPASAMAAGLVLAAVGFGMLSQVDPGSGPAVLVGGSVVLSLGLAPVFTLVTTTVLASTPPERAGAASALSETSTEFGGALGIAVLGSVGAAVYRGEVAGAIPAGVRPEDAEVARHTLGGAIAVAERLPGQVGPDLLDTARAAFTDGLHVTAAISVVAMIGIAAVVTVLLRHMHTGAETVQTTEAQQATQPMAA